LAAASMPVIVLTNIAVVPGDSAVATVSAVPVIDDGSRRGAGADVVPLAPGGWGVADAVKPLPLTTQPALVPGGQAGGKPAAVSEGEWLQAVAAAWTKREETTDGRDTVFAQLGDQEVYPDLSDAAPVEVWE